MATAQEWLDIAVICEPCHVAYHEAMPFMPRGHASRADLLNELAVTLSKAGRRPTHYEQHGDELIEKWVATPIIIGGLLKEISASKTKAKTTRPEKKPKLPPAPKKKRWRPPVENFSAIQAKAFLRHGRSYIFNSPEFRDAYGIGDDAPDDWQTLLANALRRVIKNPRLLRKNHGKGC